LISEIIYFERFYIRMTVKRPEMIGKEKKTIYVDIKRRLD